jgi:hypothetical protein
MRWSSQLGMYKMIQRYAVIWIKDEWCRIWLCAIYTAISSQYHIALCEVTSRYFFMTNDTESDFATIYCTFMMPLCIRVGWFLTFLHFQQKYPWDLLYTFQKYRNQQKTIFWPSDRFIIGPDYIEVQNFFFTIRTSWVSKDAELYVDFKNINLT